MNYIITETKEPLESIKDIKYLADSDITHKANQPYNRFNNSLLEAVKTLKEEGKNISVVLDYKSDYVKPNDSGGSIWYLDELVSEINSLFSHNNSDIFDYVYINLKDCLYKDSWNVNNHYVNLAEPWYVYQGIHGDIKQIYKKLKWFDYKGELFNPVSEKMKNQIKNNVLIELTNKFQKDAEENLKELSSDELLHVLENV
jgi:hypothetical protein